jgi:hypothetical protein
VTLPETPPALPPAPRQRNSGCATAILIIVGIILLLPGLCSLIAMANLGLGEGAVVWLWLIPFAIAAGGIALIVFAARNS